MANSPTSKRDNMCRAKRVQGERQTANAARTVVVFNTEDTEGAEKCQARENGLQGDILSAISASSVLKSNALRIRRRRFAGRLRFECGVLYFILPGEAKAALTQEFKEWMAVP